MENNFNSTVFPFESKAAEAVLKRFRSDIIERYLNDGSAKLPKYIVAYDAETDRFYGISGKRCLERNYASARPLTSESFVNIKDSYKFCRPFSINEDSVNFDEMLMTYGLDDYDLAHPDDGSQYFDNYDGMSLFEKLNYKINYLEHPSFYYLMKEGFQLFIGIVNTEGFYNYEEIDESGKKAGDIFGLSECLCNLLKDNEAVLEVHYNIEDLKKLSRCGKLTDEQIYDLVKNYGIRLSTLLTIFESGAYDHDSLVSYLERCQKYQAIPTDRAASLLSQYRFIGKEYGLQINMFPNSLVRDYMRNTSIESCYLKAERAVEHRISFYKKIKNRDLYEYQNERFAIRFEDDDELIQTVAGDRYERYPIWSDGHFYWVKDKRDNIDVMLIKYHFLYDYCEIVAELQNEVSEAKRFLKEFKRYIKKKEMKSRIIS